MILNQADNIMFISQEVQKVFLGTELIWERNHYDSTKVAVVLLDENMQETEDVTYFSGFLPSVSAFLEANSNKNYAIFIGDEIDSHSIEFSTGEFANLLNLIKVQISGVISWIPANAFAGCRNLQSVTLKNGIQTIDIMAFAYCESLTSVSIPNSVTTFYERIYPSIGGNTNPMSGAFYMCSSLSSVTLSENLTKIPRFTFYDCENLSGIAIPDDVTVISDHAFEGCESMTAATFGEGVRRIEQAAFKGCFGLTTVRLNSGLTYLGFEAFSGCTSIRKITIPDTVSDVSCYPYGSQFYGCTSLEEIKMSANMPTIPNGFLLGCSSLEKITLPDAPDAVENGAFRGCEKLKELELPESVSSIGANAFYDCSALKEINIPIAVTSIGNDAFRNCESLEGISIPTRISTLGNTTFTGCSKLRNITVHNREYHISDDPWGAPNFISTASKYDRQSRGLPMPEGKTSVFWAGVSGEEIAQCALISKLNNSGTVVSYDLSTTFSGIRTICTENPNAFYTVQLGDGFNVEAEEHSYTVPAGCFSNVSNIKSIYISSRFREIEENAFQNCSGLETIIIDKQKNEISGEPWGASAGTAIYYTAKLSDALGEFFTASDGVLSVRTAGSDAAFNTELSGIDLISQLPQNPQNKKLYILKKSGAFVLKLGGKGVDL